MSKHRHDPFPSPPLRFSDEFWQTEPLFSSSSRSRALGGLTSQPSVKVTLREEALFCDPHLGATVPTNDPVLDGTVALFLPSTRAVKKLKVVLRVTCDRCAGPGSQYESTKLLQKVIEHDLKGETLEAGHHAFNFSFIMPSTAPTTHLSNFGRTLHTVKATVSFASRLHPAVSSLLAPFFYTPRPHSGDIPLPTDVTLDSESADLGPVGFHFSSPSLTQSALGSLRLFLPSLPQTITILAVRGIIEQSYEIRYSTGKAGKSQETVELPPLSPDELAAFHAWSAARPTPPPSADDAPSQFPPPSHAAEPPALPTTLPPESEFTYTTLLRIPSHRKVHMSTREATVTPIRVSHRLGVEVVYRKGGEKGEKFSFRLTKPAEMTSCLDNLALPGYSSDAPEVEQKGKMASRHAPAYASIAV
ncbi:hypothetical protein JCM10213v2_004236 [Rhodosporidiobolus nylandii]